MTRNELLTKIITKLLEKLEGFEFYHSDGNKPYDHLRLSDSTIILNDLKISEVCDIYLYEEDFNLENGGNAWIKYSDIKEVEII